jgi:hypothetical protein
VHATSAHASQYPSKFALSLNQEKLQWSKLESTNAENCMSEAMASSTGTYGQQKKLEKSSEQVTARYA